jgi:type IV pilus assembly protein PilQ
LTVLAATRGYTTEQPARIALDLPGVTSQLAIKNRDLGSGNAHASWWLKPRIALALIISLTHAGALQFASRR